MARERAEKGDVKAQSELGFLYQFGAGGVQRDYAEALKWFGKAAEQGDTAATQSIADIYFEGTGVERAYAEAARWYGCPRPNAQALASCRAINYKDLPQGTLDLLAKRKSDSSTLASGISLIVVTARSNTLQ